MLFRRNYLRHIGLEVNGEYRIFKVTDYSDPSPIEPYYFENISETAPTAVTAALTMYAMTQNKAHALIAGAAVLAPELISRLIKSKIPLKIED